MVGISLMLWLSLKTTLSLLGLNNFQVKFNGLSNRTPVLKLPTLPLTDNNHSINNFESVWLSHFFLSLSFVSSDANVYSIAFLESPNSCALDKLNALAAIAYSLDRDVENTPMSSVCTYLMRQPAGRNFTYAKYYWIILREKFLEVMVRIACYAICFHIGSQTQF